MSRRRRRQIQEAPSAALHSRQLSHTEKVREQLLQQLIEMPPVAFEQIIAHWLKASGSCSRCKYLRPRRAGWPLPCFRLCKASEFRCDRCGFANRFVAQSYGGVLWYGAWRR